MVGHLVVRFKRRPRRRLVVGGGRTPRGGRQQRTTVGGSTPGASPRRSTSLPQSMCPRGRERLRGQSPAERSGASLWASRRSFRRARPQTRWTPSGGTRSWRLCDGSVQGLIWFFRCVWTFLSPQTLIATNMSLLLRKKTIGEPPSRQLSRPEPILIQHTTCEVGGLPHLPYSPRRSLRCRRRR